MGERGVRPPRVQWAASSGQPHPNLPAFPAFAFARFVVIQGERSQA